MASEETKLKLLKKVHDLRVEAHRSEGRARAQKLKLARGAQTALDILVASEHRTPDQPLP